MELTRDFSINDLGEDLFEVDSDGVTKILKLSRLQASSARDTMKIVNSNTVSQRLKDQHIAKLKIELMGCEDYTYEDENQIDVDTDTLKLKTTLNAFINFFKDVEFEPSLRFTNSVALCNNFASAVSYITNYFELQGNSYYDIISDKCSSVEFKDLLHNIIRCKPKTKINNRLEVYYGPQGTGKTTKALSKTNDCIVCHSGMLPQDLMEDFTFNEGKPTFQKSALWNAIDTGSTIVLDELNLLPLESLRFLQTLLDNKDVITYKGKQINIKPGFKIIGTMNLIVNGSKYPLPEPLVDRCENIEKFNMTADMLLSAVI